MKLFKFLKITLLGLILTLNISADEEVQEVVVISSKYPVPLQEVVGSVDSISLEAVSYTHLTLPTICSV